jgi:hypothetical protein
VAPQVIGPSIWCNGRGAGCVGARRRGSLASSPQIIISIPSRGPAEHLPTLLAKLASTKSEAATVVVASAGPQKFVGPGLPGIHVIDIGDIPTIPVAVNFACYGLCSRSLFHLKPFAAG